MYDTINIRNEVVGGKLPAILNRLESITEHTNAERHTYTGYLGNYKVNVSDAGIWMTGSLSKYYLGDNISTLTRSDAARAIEKLSDELGLNINKAKVTRADLAANLLMKHPPETYYPFLIECHKYDRHLKKNSLYFSNGYRCMIFYNKLDEAIKKGVTIPEAVQGRNLLRYELRIEKRVNRQLNADVIGAMLTDEKFYMNLVNRWHAEYHKINKEKKFILNSETMKSPKDFWKQGNQQWLQLIGLDAALRMVDQLKAMQTFDKPEYYSRLKREIKEIYSQPENTQPVELIKELDKKIHRITLHYR